MAKVDLPGSEIQKALEHSFKKYDGKSPRGEVLQVSGKPIWKYLYAIIVHYY